MTSGVFRHLNSKFASDPGTKAGTWKCFCDIHHVKCSTNRKHLHSACAHDFITCSGIFRLKWIPSWGEGYKTPRVLTVITTQEMFQVIYFSHPISKSWNNVFSSVCYYKNVNNTASVLKKRHSQNWKNNNDLFQWLSGLTLWLKNFNHKLH